MAWTQEEMELNREKGLIPDYAWYQINGKSAEENFIEILKNRQKKSQEKTNLHISSEIKVK